MAINFPNNPGSGEIYTEGNKSWQWLGNRWGAYNIQNPEAFAFRNKIINGDMKISQRYGTTTQTATNVNGLGLPVDRFCFTDGVGANWPTNGVITYRQNSNTSLPRFSNSIFLSTTTAGTIGVNSSCGIRQSIEGINISDLAWGTSSAEAITISFWVKSSLTGTHSLAVNGLINDRTTTRVYASTYNISSTSWEYKSITIPGDTTAPTTWFTGTSAAGLNVIWGLGAGSNFQVTPNNWSTGGQTTASGSVNIIANAGATFEITGVQLEKGPTATPFEHRPIGTELSLCQRYYCKSFSPNTVPASNISEGYLAVHEPTAPNGTIHNSVTKFPVTMRASPVVTFYNPFEATAVNTIYMSSANNNRATIASYEASPYGVSTISSSFAYSGTEPTASLRVTQWQFTASAEL